MPGMSDDPELVKEFLTETKELLDNLDNDLVSLETDPQNSDLLNRIFRAVHTIKGTSSFLGYEQLVELGHVAEDVLSLLRNGELVVTPSIMDVLLKSNDKLKILVKQIEDKEIKKIDLSHVLHALTLIKENGFNEGAHDDVSESEIQENAVKIPIKEIRGESDLPLQKDQSKKKKLEAEPKELSISMESSTIRVDVNRLDNLMNLVGELVLERNRLLQINRDFRMDQQVDHFTEKVAETAEKIHFVTSELQLSVLKTRMVPIDRLYRKFPRVIRDIARDLNKEVDLEMIGGETELDKTVIDQLGDPLVHILRNSIDHGLEPADDRLSMGKNRKGTVVLSASQEGNHIIISVKDDGRGINIEKVKQKALEKELITQTQLQTMGKQDIIKLLFEPGFSTADNVSDLSGRGVGMDVVRTNIRNLNGIIDVFCEDNVGTEFILKLPLTLAVIQALMVYVGHEIYAIPLASVIETLRIQNHEIKSVDKREVICHRDSVIPLFRLDRIYQTNGKYTKEEKKLDDYGYVVLVGIAEKRFGLVVDRLLGQEEVVIKSLGEYLGNVAGLSGSTITGDGRVRLIIDCGAVSSLA